MSRVRSRTFSIATTAAVLVAAVAVASACGGNDDDPSAAKGQVSLEVYAEVQQAGIGGITQMPDGQLIVGYHPFYQTATSTQIALLNADRKSTTPYPAGLRQTCRNADGSFLPPSQRQLRLLPRLGAGIPCRRERNPVDPRLASSRPTRPIGACIRTAGRASREATSGGIPRRTRCSRSSTSTPSTICLSRSTTTSQSTSKHGVASHR